jgi:hypothetical protein
VQFRKPDERERDWLAMIPLGVVYFSLAHFLPAERALLFAIMVGAFYVAVSREWDRRGERRFWLLVTLLLAVHSLIFAAIRMPQFSGPSLAYVLPIAFIDVFGLWGILRWAQAWTRGDDRND